MITFEQARQIVQEKIGGRYPVDAEFTVAPWGWETEDVYILDAGPYAAVYRPRNAEEYKWLKPSDQPLICVNKTTGAITQRQDAPQPNTPCGAPNPDDE